MPAAAAHGIVLFRKDAKDVQQSQFAASYFTKQKERELGMSDNNNVLQLLHITKKYPGVVALNDVSLKVRKGEVHALIGENGAGKSTLIKTCSGAVIPDEGEIIINGIAYKSMTPKQSLENGIAIIYQEFNLVRELSVAENVFLGNEIKKGIIVDKKAMNRETAKIFQSLHIHLDPSTPVKELSVGYQQMVEIAKAIRHNIQVLIMDEPSAPLTAQEVEAMFQVVEQLKARGVSIVYISHRLEEIFRLADRITVLRDGQYIKTMETEKTTQDELVMLMVGRTLNEKFPARNVEIEDEIIFEMKNVCGNGDTNISFQIKKGEILGLGGLVGAGRTEIAQMIFGIKPIQSGEMFLHGKRIAPYSPQEAIQLGIALVPEDRKQQGVMLGMDIRSNISMPIYPSISKLTVVNSGKENKIAENYKNELNIKTPTIRQKVKNLSGGNQQKVILGKWLAADTELIVLDEPTRGIDIAAKYEIYKLMNDIVAKGKTILLVSSEMEELMGMSDRIIVLAEGKITGELQKEEFSQEIIMKYASGIEKEAASE